MKLISKKKILIFVTTIFLLGAAGFGYYDKPWEDKPDYLTILHTNDVHGRLEPFQYQDSHSLVGGIARRAALIKQIEGANKCAITLDAGDFAQGSVFFNLFNGIPDAELMSQAGYDAGTLGNHEFDKGLTFLKNIIKHATYPFVTANIRFTNDPELQALVQPYIIKDCHGLKVAIIGLTTEDLKTEALVKNIEVFDATETTKNIVKKINSHADLIIVLSHNGVKEDFKLAKSVPEVDIIVGGHSHTLLNQPKVFYWGGDKTLVLQAGELGAYLGRLDVKFKDKKIENYYYELIPVNEEIKPDKIINKEIDVLTEQTGQYTNEIIGQLAVPISIEGEKIRSKLLPAGALVTQAVKDTFPDVDLVLQNSGGIRPYKHLGPGAITMGDIMNLFPFDNTIVTLELKGEDLKSVLETSSSMLPDNNGGFLQSLGLRYTVDTTKSQRDRVSNITINRNPLEQEKYYKIAINNYIFEGGNGYTQFKNGVNIKQSNIMVRDAIVDYIKKHSPVTVNLQDRIRLKDS